MRNVHDIILQPVITERSTMDTAEGKYTFRVAKDATKTEVRQACEKLFGVKVLKVNTLNVKGKVKRQGYTQGRTAAWKKAIVTIDQNPGTHTYTGKGGAEVKHDRKYKTTIEEFGFGQ